MQYKEEDFRRLLAKKQEINRHWPNKHKRRCWKNTDLTSKLIYQVYKCLRRLLKQAYDLRIIT